MMATGQVPATAPISTRVHRSRKDATASAIGAMVEVGCRFRWRGAVLEITGLEHLHPADRALVNRLWPGISDRLAEPGETDPEALLEQLDIEVELVDMPERARGVIASLPPAVAIDLETMARPEFAVEPPWLAITRDGRRAVRQPKPDKIGLDPLRAQPRLVQAFDPGRSTVFVFDMLALSWADLTGLLERKILMHNAAFDLAMLAAQGVEPARYFDTLQLAACAFGTGKGARQLKTVARRVLGIELPKDLQVSDWAAPALSDGQLAYAAADAVVTYQAAGRMWNGMLGPRERGAFRLQNAALRPIVRMRLRGIPFDRGVHEQTVAGWQEAYAGERARFREITVDDAPASQPETVAWLERVLTPEAFEAWPRTDSGNGPSTKASDLKKLALQHPEIRPLLAVQRAQKRVSTFGAKLSAMVSPVTGRLHGDFFCYSKTGRLNCSKPNLLQLPPDARAAVIAPPGRVFVDADLGQIELRCLAELAGEQVMRAAFAEGVDIHRLTASTIVGRAPEDVSDADRALAKPANFGVVYGMGARGLRSYAWKNYDLEWTLAEADRVRSMLFDTYPGIRPYQNARAEEARINGVLYSIAGRPPRPEWEPDGEIWFTSCCNFGIQASAADVLLEALIRVDRALPGALVLSIHDEILLEVPEDEAEAAAATLTECMTEAFMKWFPGATTRKLVEAKTGRCWGEFKWWMATTDCLARWSRSRASSARCAGEPATGARACSRITRASRRSGARSAAPRSTCT
jgi:DNA polymerase I